MVFYSGHGGNIGGTQRVYLHDDSVFALEVRIRNFRNEYSDNAYVWAVFDCCRDASVFDGQVVKAGKIGRAHV